MSAINRLAGNDHLEMSRALPEFSEATASVLKKTDAVAQNQTLKDYDYGLTTLLKGRITSLETADEALKTIQDHKTREVVIAGLKTALLCALIAGIVFVGIFVGQHALPIALGIGIVYLVVSMLVCEPIYERMQKFNQDYLWNPVWWPGLGKAGAINALIAPFVPFYDVLTREKRIHGLFDRQKTQTVMDLHNFLAFAEQLDTNGEAIQQQLNANRETLQAEKLKFAIPDQPLSEGVAEAHRVTRENLEAQITAIDTALGELVSFKTYYETL